MDFELPFDPFPFLSGSHQQTILGSFLNFQREPKSKTVLVPLSDGDKISLEVTTPENWDVNGLTVIMVHGLCGSHRSPYLIRMSNRLSTKGIRCVRFNMRGCGSGKGHAKQIYHSGRSGDLWEVIRFLSKETPHTQFAVMGFSLGGHIVLKMIGELGEAAKGIIRQAIAISPPVDLYQSVQILSSPSNIIYEKYFLHLLKENVRYRHRHFTDLPPVTLPRKISMYHFDELYTAPQCGFKNAMDYYEKSRSDKLVGEIKVPCRILFSEDDPLVCSTSLDAIRLPEMVELYKTRKGGHMGFLTRPGKHQEFHWMDQILESWILR